MKKFHLHADALIVCVALFALSLGGNLFLFLEMRRLGTENVQLRVQTTLDSMNLGSLRESLDTCLADSAEKDPLAPEKQANPTAP